MALMDTRYPAYEVLKKSNGTISYLLRRLEPDRKKGLIVREDSRFGLFGDVKEVLRPQSYAVLKTGETSPGGVQAESELYLCLTDETGREIVYRFTSPTHLRVITKYLAFFTQRH